MSIIHDLIDEATSRLRGQPVGSVLNTLASAQPPAMAQTPLRGSVADTLGMGSAGAGDQLRSDMQQRLLDQRKKTTQAVSPGNTAMYATASADVFGGKGY